MEKLTHDILITNGWVKNEFYPPLGCYLYKRGNKEVALKDGEALPYNDETGLGMGVFPSMTGIIETIEQLKDYE